MSERKHISAKRESYNAADAVREEDESWSEFLERAAEALESGVETEPETDLQKIAGKLDDLRAELPKELGDEVENRLTGR